MEKSFDNDLINRKKSGVKHYRIYLPSDYADFLSIELNFDYLDKAQQAQTALLNIFPKIEESLIFGALLKIMNVVELKDI